MYVSFVIILGGLIPALSASSLQLLHAEAEKAEILSLESQSNSLAEFEHHRSRRALITINVFYHPGNPYSCYTSTSKLYCTSKTFKLQIESMQLVQSMKKAIQDQEGYPADLQVAKHNRTVLKDNRTLASYSIDNNSLIDLTLIHIPQ